MVSFKRGSTVYDNMRNGEIDNNSLSTHTEAPLVLKGQLFKGDLDQMHS